VSAVEQAPKGGRFKYVLRVVGYFVLLAIINTLTFEIGDVTSPFLPAWLGSILEGLFYLGATLLLTWAFCRFLEQSPLSSLGLQKHGWLAHVGTGLALGGFLILLAFALLWLGGWATIKPSDSWQSPGFLASLFTWIIISLVEEISFRGYIMQGLIRAWGTPVAVIVSSLLFGMVHSLNPNATLLGVLVISGAGVLLAIAYLVTKSLWLPIGLHIGWNLVEIHALGFPGSGHTEPALLHTVTNGPEWLTGGAFGPEGGLLVLLVELVGIAILYSGYRMTLAKQSQQ
jgi:membrane protease YdiL (CAAX protease family)